MVNAGIVNPSVSAGSEPFIKATAIGQVVASLYAANAVAAQNAQPVTATGAALDVAVSNVGLSRLTAGPSIGAVTFASSGSALVAPTNQLVSSAGLIFAVSTGGVYNAGDSIPIVAVTLGSQTNLPSGTVLTWINPPAGSSSTATIAVGGMTDGVDAETDEALYARFASFMANPPANGNAVHFNQLAESSTTGITSFCYPAYNGPGTVKVSVCRAPTQYNKGRDVDATLMSYTVIPTVVGGAPEHCDVLVTTVTNVPTDISLGLALTDGQWVDSVRFPDNATNGGAYGVLAVTSDTNFTIYSTVAPTPGISHIAWFSPYDFTLYRAKVLTSAVAGFKLFAITLDSPLPGISSGDLPFPDCVNAQAYCDAVLKYFANLGPGESTNVAGLLPRALRHPKPGIAHPATVTYNINKELTNFAEVSDSQTLVASQNSPAVPTHIYDPPFILVSAKIAVYELV